MPSKNYMTDEICQQILDASEFVVTTVFDKCTVVACKLPNGYVIVEKAVCLNEETYDIKVGQQMCYELIANKIWEMQQFKMLDDVTEIINKQVYKGHKPAKQEQQYNYFDKEDKELSEALKEAGIYFDGDIDKLKH